MTSPRPIDGRLLVVLGAALWGTSGAAVAIGPAGATVWQVAVLRMVVGAPPLIALSWLARGWAPLPRPWGAALAASATMAAFQVAYFAAVTLAGVAIGTAVAIGSAPIAAGALQRLTLGRRPERAWWPATGLAVSGIVLLLGATAGAGNASPLGILAGLVAGASFAGFAVAGRRVLDRAGDAFGAMGWLLVGAGCALAPVAVGLTVLTDASWGWLGSTSGAAMVAWLSLVATTGAYALFGRGLLTVPPASAATLALAEPLTAVALGMGLLGERPGGTQVSGIVLVLGGLIVLMSPRARARLQRRSASTSDRSSRLARS